MRWAVTGAAGMLGADLVHVLRECGREIRPLSRSDLDVRDLEACRGALASSDVVVNAAAWTDVDAAESAADKAFAVNAVGAANVARAAREAGAVLLQISTDYVFSGSASAPYAPGSPLGPINAYGRSKAAGEWAARAECAEARIVRTSWLFGEHGPNFVRTMMRLEREGGTVEVVDDQTGQPTWTRDLSAHLVDLVERAAAPGIYHATAGGETTWFGLASAVFEELGADPARVQPTSSGSYQRAALRPAYSVLARGESSSFIGPPLPHWRSALTEAMKRLTPANG